MRPLSLRPLVLVLMGTLGCRTHAADVRVQKLVSVYVPGLEIGTPAPSHGTTLHLLPAAHVAQVDTSFRGADGVHVLTLYYGLNEQRTARANVVQTVQLGLPNGAAFSRVLARVRTALGKPVKDFCADGLVKGTKTRVLLWMSANGRSVMVSGDPDSFSTSDEADTLSESANWLSLNADPLPVGEIRNASC